MSLDRENLMMVKQCVSSLLRNENCHDGDFIEFLTSKIMELTPSICKLCQQDIHPQSHIAYSPKCVYCDEYQCKECRCYEVLNRVIVVCSSCYERSGEEEYFSD